MRKVFYQSFQLTSLLRDNAAFYKTIKQVIFFWLGIPLSDSAFIGYLVLKIPYALSATPAELRRVQDLKTVLLKF